MWSPHEIYNAMGQHSGWLQTRYRGLLDEVLVLKVTTKIPRCADKAPVLGIKRFRERVSRLVL